MKPINKSMKKYLRKNGIDAMPKLILTGSLKGCWRLYKKNVTWWNNTSLQNRLKNLGFVGFDNKELNNFSGNGGMFHVFARNNEFINQFYS